VGDREDRPVDEGRQRALRVPAIDAEPRHGREGQQRPVADQQSHDGQDDAADVQAQPLVGIGPGWQDADRAGQGVAETDPLQDARNAQMGQVEARQGVERQAQQDQQRRAAGDLDPQGGGSPLPDPQAGDGQADRHADAEQKGRKHQVGGRPPAPGRVLERRVGVLPRSRAGHQDHARDGQSSQNIERNDPSAISLRRIHGLPPLFIGETLS
jgi:hypothetical protein